MSFKKNANAIKQLALYRWELIIKDDGGVSLARATRLFDDMLNNCSYCATFKDNTTLPHSKVCGFCPLRKSNTRKTRYGCCYGVMYKWILNPTRETAQAVYDFIRSVSVTEIRKALIKKKRIIQTGQSIIKRKGENR